MPLCIVEGIAINRSIKSQYIDRPFHHLFVQYMHTRCQIFYACRCFKVSGDYFCLSSKFCKALLLLKPLGKFCFVEKVQAKIYALFKAWMILVFPLASFSLKLGVLEYENLQFLMATFRKMRGHFLHENTDVFLPPHYSFRHYGYHIFCRLFPQRYSRKKRCLQ